MRDADKILNRMALALTVLGVLLLTAFILVRTIGGNYCCDGPCFDLTEESR